ncbi:Dopey protein [Ancylostoma ceylanicum]|uniref:Dopey protein n=1 Tax=Ancylostoma ceylanicum TaxID=53326 RepID=A0A0D6LEC6_9BILA|nr:Dopey protein [Ancylostoma ceylanicum]
MRSLGIFQSQLRLPNVSLNVFILLYQWALETYRQIFDILGPQSLPKLLYLFAVGLFPLMDHCGIKVKSELFNIFEQYLLPLGQNLRPALPGFLAGVLLGLEEGTEFYDRSLSVLDRVCEGVGERAFFACLWQAVLGSPSVRLPAMLYVNAKFDKTRSLDDQIAIVGDHVNHMDRRLDEITKTFNLLLNSLEPGFLFDFLGSWFTRLISVDDPCSESIAQFAKVVTFCLETCNLDGDRALRSQFLPKLLSLILNGLHNDKNLMVIESTALLQRCGHAIWLGLGLSWCAYEHERLSRLMALLHSRKPNEPSSDMENIIVSALTSNDTVRSLHSS